MGSISIDNNKNQSAGTKGTSKGSLYFRAGSDSSSSVHEVTLNYDTGHWCSCRGMIAKKRKFGSVADTHQPTSLPQTSRHFCKHIQAIRTADSSIRVEARRMRNEFFGINEDAFDPETGVAPVAPVAAKPATGRRAAVKASREAKAARGDQSARERLAQIEAADDKLRAQVEIEDTIKALSDKHGINAVKAALEVA
jgi:hypothetical protein